MKSRTICWRCVSPCIVFSRLLNVRSIVKKWALHTPYARTGGAFVRLFGRLRASDLLVASPKLLGEALLSVDVARLAHMIGAIFALQLLDEVRIHPPRQLILVGAIEKHRAALMAGIADGQ